MATAPAGLAFAAGRVDITPTRPLPLAGYAGRTALCDGVADPLEANAVVITGGGKPPVVLVTFDLLYVGAELRRRLEQALGLVVPPDRLFLAASHTHFAPATDPTLHRLGLADGDYLDRTAARVAALVRGLLGGRRQPLTLAVASGHADHSVNRRHLGWRVGRRYPFLTRTVTMKANPDGARDETVRVIRLGPRVVVWSYACHPVFVPWMNHVSADYVGVVRRVIRRALGPETVVLFWQGFSCDVFPSIAPTPSGTLARLRGLWSHRPSAVAPDVWRHWAGGLAQRVRDTVRRATAPAAVRHIDCARVGMPLWRLLGPDAPDRTVWAHRLDLGPQARVLGVSAELPVGYLATCQRLFGADGLFCVGCTDGVVGYLPTARMVREGGYEAAEFLPYFGLAGRFSADVEDEIRARLLAPLVADRRAAEYTQPASARRAA
jgi:hypothetical protein